MKHFRTTTQDLAPSRRTPTPPGTYDIYPAFPLPDGRITLGFALLAERILASGRSLVTIEGFTGVLWDTFVDGLGRALQAHGVVPRWRNVADALLPESDVGRLIAPFTGGDDPLFGTRCTLTVRDFFDSDALRRMGDVPPTGITIVYGPGSSLAAPGGFLVYVDVPKNEAQFRSRTGCIANFAARAPLPAKQMYKRMYFVDWPVLNRHRAALLGLIDLMVDAQRPDEPALLQGSDFREGLDVLARQVIRVRPWFEPGPWGGQWIKTHVPQVAQDAPNYAWSFELIAPENGIAFESDGCVFEASFDFLMLHNHRDVLGSFAARFGYEFPIRYDFLDTVRGGNLSLQCHPRSDYMHRHFGESFTQDEAYYILDCVPGARVYLGFREGVDPAAFRRELEASFRDNTPVDVEAHVMTVEAHTHDLFLIPAGTIHCSGAGNLVLEISATPYIFTFKMYDWMRTDLDGVPRPINIARAFENLAFERQGERVRQELVARPSVTAGGPGWRIVHLPTHPAHFYDVQKFEFEDSIDGSTGGSCQVMNLVEGEWITVETAGGMRQRINYAETFIIPAAAGSFRMINGGRRKAKVVATFLKPDARPFAPPEGAEG
jgi:mannose-6-phosphate isomerase class I